MDNTMEFIKRLFIEGYATINISIGIIVGCILCTLLLAMYVYV